MRRKFTKIKISELYLAYRKAKADAFYENTHFHAVDFTRYEQKLNENLLALQRRLNDPRPDWHTDQSFIGDHAYLPKSISTEAWDSGSDGHFRALDPFDDWENRYEKSAVPATANLRLVIRPTVDFQIVSALWIIHVGHLFDAVLDREKSFGNRLRRLRNDGDNSDGGATLNLNTPSLFAPYFSAYQEWRERGLSTMERALDEGKNVLAVTMDISKFYHRVSPAFLLRPSFLSTHGIELTPDQKQFTQYLLDAINTWYEGTPDYAERPQGAIPVGLSASKIIANVLLAEFDARIGEQVCPLYYGRYVDDLFLVLDTTDEDQGAINVGNRLARALTPYLKVQRSEDGPPSMKLSLPYAKDSELIFTGAKQKIFALSSKHGADLIHYIREQIRVQSSEYRLLPAVPTTASKMASRALLATPDATLQVDALRKADVVSVRRLGFALLLSDVETYAMDLTPDTWVNIRREFYALAQRHIITPIGFFDYFSYVPRIFGLMLACGDLDDAQTLIDNLVRVANVLRRTTTVGSSTEEEKFDLCLEQYCHALLEAGLQAGSAKAVAINEDYVRVLRRIKRLKSNVRIASTPESIRALVDQILFADWGRRPYKDYWFTDQRTHTPGPPVPRQFSVRKQIRLGALRRFLDHAVNVKTPHWPALAFPTRPLRVDEIPLVAPDALKDTALFREAISILRGAEVLSDEVMGFVKSPPEKPLFTFAMPSPTKNSVRVAVTSKETTIEQWEAAAKNKHDRSVGRYETFNNLINRILEEEKRPDYIVLPELSIPLRWALRAARKLATNGVSFLAGVEYHRDRVSRKLRNDSLISLTTRWPGYASNVVVLQSKFQPSHGERDELKKVLKKDNSFHETASSAALPTVYQHGNFFFSVIVCSDLTNITHRQVLRGGIDALFALEWNQDTKTFSSLVEATASDLHVYVVQANNRTYGDSRIRAPAAKDYARDIVQVKGGMSDYYVLGEIEHRKLRNEQRKPPPPKKAEFKPLPIGYKLSLSRRLTP